MTRAVLDTNVIVSGALRADGNEAAVLQLVISGRMTMCATPAILLEYMDVLARPKLGLDQRKVRRLLDAIRAVAVVVKPSFTLSVSDDDADNRFLECAEALEADFLVTGNRRHFPRQWKTTRIVTSRELLVARAQDLVR